MSMPNVTMRTNRTSEAATGRRGAAIEPHARHAATGRLDAAVDRCLHVVGTLGGGAGFGSVATILLEYDAVPVVMARSADGRPHLTMGAPGAIPARVLAEARRRAGHDRGTADTPRRDDSSTGPGARDALEVGRVRLDSSGSVVTARVELMHGSRRIVATSVGRNAEERRLFLTAEAAARAVTQFLPHDYGVVLQGIGPLPDALGRALRAVVLFLTPTEEQPLEGIARIDGDAAEAAARTVLSAVQDRVKPLLKPAGTGPGHPEDRLPPHLSIEPAQSFEQRRGEVPAPGH